jgi:acyl dehydratase
MAVARAGTITDEALADLRARIGRETRTRDDPRLEEITKDAIRNWSRAIGDRDPLWVDEEYAKETRYGGLVAPPSIVYGLQGIAIGDRGGLPGVHSFFGGAEHHWYSPVRRNDTIKVRSVLKEVNERRSSFSRRMIEQISEVTFTNQDGEVVARSFPYGMRTERSTAKEVGKYKDRPLASYTPQQIDEIAEWYEHEPELVRGGSPRYWEDVHVGDAITEILRGPWTPTISICFLGVMGSLFMKTHGFWFDYIRRHPRAGITNEFGVPEGPARGHWDSEFARRVGVPAAYDYGPERIAWMCSLLTYWAGDDGWLKRLYVEVREFNLIGDLTKLAGRVTGKRVEEGEALIDCDVWARDQRGADTVSGTATVVLPTRLPPAGAADGGGR